MKIQNVSLDSLIPYARNTKKHDETQISNVAESIKQFGFVQPVVIDNQNEIVIGHCRVLAAKRLEMSEVPCVCVSDLTPEQVNALRIVDNKTNESEWDIEYLMQELNDIDLSSFDFDFGLEMDMDDADLDVVEDEVPEVDEAEPISKLGQIWQLGRHRLMCGDSTEPDDVAKLMDGATADLVLTDPPYNVAVENSQGMTIENDNMDSHSFYEFLYKAFGSIESNLKPGGVFYIWFASCEHINFETALNDNGLTARQELIWNKNSFNIGRQDYQWKHEACLYGWKSGAAHYFVDDRTQATVFEDERPDFKKMKKAEMQELLEKIFSDKISSTVINEDKPAANDMHPTMKPIKLLARQIKNSSKQGELVLDLFGGSGSTLMACEQLNRTCNIMEFDPKYADVIIKRWEDFTGGKAILLR